MSTTESLPLLTVDQTAQHLGIGRTSVYQLIKSGELRSVRIGGLRRVHADDITDYVQRLRARS